ncbi:MAG: hypothetical protein M3Z24_10480 [Chloroflexota bacterium]|nr:hypothetical protein [Chloroflexota bacterium]
MNPQRIELHIEELVLHGFAPGDRYAIGEAVQCELQRLFTRQGIPPHMMQQSRSVGRLDGGTFSVDPAAQADIIGTQVAHSVYEGLTGQTPTREGQDR